MSEAVEERIADKRRTRGLSAESRFWFYAFPEPNSGCWLWTGHLCPKGYGMLWNGKKQVRAHRYSYLLLVGPIPPELVLDHKCRTRSCVNPDHLRAVTQRVNATENSDWHAAVNAAKTHCAKGHKFTPENTILRSTHGWRGCRQCKMASNERFRRKIYKTTRVFKVPRGLTAALTAPAREKPCDHSEIVYPGSPGMECLPRCKFCGVRVNAGSQP